MYIAVCIVIIIAVLISNYLRILHSYSS